MLEFGRTNNMHREMAIGIPAFRIGRWTVLATLVHELAHQRRPGGNDRRAEEAVLACGMGRRSEKDFWRRRSVDTVQPRHWRLAGNP